MTTIVCTEAQTQIMLKRVCIGHRKLSIGTMGLSNNIEIAPEIQLD